MHDSVRWPSIDIDLFANRRFVTGVFGVFVFYSSISSFFLSLAMLLQFGLGLGLAPPAAGWLLTPSAVALFVGSLTGRKLAHRCGSNALLLADGVRRGARAIRVCGKAMLIKPRVPRDQLVVLISQLPACLIGMEACSGAHHWARVFQQHGHTVKLMAPNLVARRIACRASAARTTRRMLPYATWAFRANPISSADVL